MLDGTSSTFVAGPDGRQDRHRQASLQKNSAPIPIWKSPPSRTGYYGAGTVEYRVGHDDLVSFSTPAGRIPQCDRSLVRFHVHKLSVIGAARTEALARSSRMLTEFKAEGLATVIPFHAAAAFNPAFVSDDESF
ncbi:hypothetical protein FFI94_032400 [Rhodococcus sp. KBS0724]|uniref:hypothetical protein n=1 Tax=Rhodococcus sp. KBS0724 TaxID=1179674 RepID=UPI00110E43BD|nr:hypothetical protein [Rhodococcus sp. KBS0724]TSD40412.1 hypothetical protein FFI94_032400 [Rhodococcus sp. KBS0724]